MKHMAEQRVKISRRAFLRGALAGGALGATLAAPLLVPASALGLDGHTPPSERIRMGFIGLGGQGGGHLLGGAWTYVAGGYVARNDVQVMAVCDIRRKRREERCARVNEFYAEKFGQGKYNACAAYTDFRELLARDDIDAVLIACPVHWHALMAMMAAEAGKDVYSEKPIAPTIQQGRALVEAVRRHGRVYQGGTQQRSEFSSKFRFVCELVRGGGIGELKEVYAYRAGGAYTWPGGGGKPQPVPDDLDWDLFLGWAQWLPYDGNAGTFRFQTGDINWTPHHFDFVHWVLDADRTGPVEVWLEEDAPAFRYASGVVVYGRPYPGERAGPVPTRSKAAPAGWNGAGMEGGACFVGTQGRVAVDRSRLSADPPGLLKHPPGPAEVPLYRSFSHAGNFLECIRTRQRTICDAETAHRANTLVLLGGIVSELKRPLKWDPQAERFVNDDEANRMLSVATRPPWRI